MNEEPRTQRAGFTLIEITIYMSVLVILGVPLISIVLASTRSTAENETFSKVEERNRTALIRMEQEVREAMSGTAVVSGFGKMLTFTSTTGFDGSAAIAGPSVGFTFQLANGETSNGMDDNGNGMADEGQLRRTDGAGGNNLICGDIDIPNSGFALNGTGVTITVASYGSLRGGDTFSLSKTMTVYPRN